MAGRNERSDGGGGGENVVKADVEQDVEETENMSVGSIKGTSVPVEMNRMDTTCISSSYCPIMSPCSKVWDVSSKNNVESFPPNFASSHNPPFISCSLPSSSSSFLSSSSCSSFMISLFSVLRKRITLSCVIMFLFALLFLFSWFSIITSVLRMQKSQLVLEENMMDLLKKKGYEKERGKERNEEEEHCSIKQKNSMRNNDVNSNNNNPTSDGDNNDELGKVRIVKYYHYHIYSYDGDESNDE
jgi:hypothetical protein